MARVYGKAPHELSPGEYGKWESSGVAWRKAGDDNWYGAPPGTDLVANLAAHKIEEHEDGTITVTPSILVSNREASWHGYLTRGNWQVC